MNEMTEKKIKMLENYLMKFKKKENPEGARTWGFFFFN